MKKETMTIRGWGRVENVYLSLLPSTADQLINTWLPSHHHDASVHFGWVQCPVGNTNEGYPLFACYNLHEVCNFHFNLINASFVGGSSTCIIFRQNAPMETISFCYSYSYFYYFFCPSQYILGKAVYLTLIALKRTNIPQRQMWQVNAHNQSLKSSSSFTFDFMNRLVLPRNGGNKSLCNIRLSLHFFSSHNKAPPHLLLMIWSICAIFQKWMQSFQWESGWIFSQANFV